MNSVIPLITKSTRIRMKKHEKEKTKNASDSFERLIALDPIDRENKLELISVSFSI